MKLIEINMLNMIYDITFGDVMLWTFIIGIPLLIIIVVVLAKCGVFTRMFARPIYEKNNDILKNENTRLRRMMASSSDEKDRKINELEEEIKKLKEENNELAYSLRSRMKMDRNEIANAERDGIAKSNYEQGKSVGNYGSADNYYNH